MSAYLVLTGIRGGAGSTVRDHIEPLGQGRYAKVRHHGLIGPFPEELPAKSTAENMCADPRRNGTQSLDSTSIFPSRGIKCGRNGASSSSFPSDRENGSLPRHRVLAALFANCACSCRRCPTQIQEERRGKVELCF